MPLMSIFAPPDEQTALEIRELAERVDAFDRSLVRPVMTVACHPLDCRMYASDRLWVDASYALSRSTEGWRYVPDSERAELARAIGTELPTHPGEYVERTLVKDLRHGGKAMIVGRDIYVAKRDRDFLTGAMERVGSIDYVCGPDAHGLQVLIYSHHYPKVLDRHDHAAAQDYALSLLS